MNSALDKQKIRYGVNLIIRPPVDYYREDHLLYQIRMDGLKEQSYHFVSFCNKKGQKINGTLFIPDAPLVGNPCVVFAHGNSCNQLFPGYNYAQLFYSKGIYVFTFDFPGTGMSEEKYITFGYDEPRTIIDVCDWLQENQNIGKFALFGHSMGGFSSLFATAIDHRFVSAAIITPYTSITDFIKIHMENLISENMDDYLQEISHEIHEKAGFNFFDVDIMPHLKDIVTPIVILHCENDKICPNWMAKLIFKNLPVEDKMELYDKYGNHSTFDFNLVEKAADFIIKHFETS